MSGNISYAPRIWTFDEISETIEIFLIDFMNESHTGMLSKAFYLMYVFFFRWWGAKSLCLIRRLS